MKTKNLFLLPALIAGLNLLPAGRLTAQTFTTLHSFAPLIPVFTNIDGVFYTNSDGGFPNGRLALSGNTMYGTAYEGGNSGLGTVFALNTDGSGFTNVHSFTGSSGGNNPVAGLIINLSGNTLHGTTVYGGSADHGTVFKLSTDGTGFTTLHTFTATSGNPPYGNSDGILPAGELPALTGTFTNLPAATNPHTDPITGPQQFFRLSQ